MSALAALIAFNDATAGTAEDIDARIADLIAELADLAGDPEAVIEAGREKAASRRPAYRDAKAVRMNTAMELVKHYRAECDRAAKAVRYAAGATLRAIKADNQASRQRNEEEWNALEERRSIARRRLSAVCAAYDAANDAWHAAHRVDADTTA